jgi:Putative peptidoglycan binding domain
MAGRGSRGDNLDDWFGEPDVGRSRPSPDATTAADDGADDDWLAGSEASTSSYPRLAGRQLTARQAAAAGAALALAILLVGLAVAGVFSGGSTPRAKPPATVPPPTSPTTTATQPTPIAAPPATTLKPGDKGAQVRTLQRALASLGHPSGKIDGQYGPATIRALKAFQAASGLTADGVLGPKTLAALAKALGKTG